MQRQMSLTSLAGKDLDNRCSGSKAWEFFGKESPMESIHFGEGSTQDQAICVLQPKNRKSTTVAENRMSCPSLVLGKVFWFILLLGSTA